MGDTEHTLCLMIKGTLPVLRAEILSLTVRSLDRLEERIAREITLARHELSTDCPWTATIALDCLSAHASEAVSLRDRLQWMLRDLERLEARIEMPKGDEILDDLRSTYGEQVSADWSEDDGA